MSPTQVITLAPVFKAGPLVALRQGTQLNTIDLAVVGHRAVRLGVAPGQNESRQSRVADDVHWKFRRWPHVPLRPKRCRHATYAVGNAGASSE